MTAPPWWMELALGENHRGSQGNVGICDAVRECVEGGKRGGT